MPDDILGEATALSAQVFGPDPVAASVVTPSDIAMIEPTAPVEPARPEMELDPDASRPLVFNPSTVSSFLAADHPDVVASLGPAAGAQIADTLGALPRDVLTLMDQEGMLGAPLTLQLMAQISRNAAAGGPDNGLVDGEVGVEHVAAQAREHGHADDVETVNNIVLFVRSLPPRVRAGISPSMIADPAIWDLASHLGSKLWASSFIALSPAAEGAHSPWHTSNLETRKRCCTRPSA